MPTPNIYIYIYSWNDVWTSMVTHTRNLCSAFNPSKCTHTHSSEHTHTVGAVGGYLPCSRVSPQSWYWGWREHALFTPPIPARPEIRTHNLRIYKSDALSIRPRLPRLCVCVCVCVCVCICVYIYIHTHTDRQTDTHTHTHTHTETDRQRDISLVRSSRSFLWLIIASRPSFSLMNCSAGPILAFLPY